MLIYALRRIIGMIPIILAISLLVFGLLQLQPGDPIDEIRLANPQITVEEIENLRKAYGLDQPFYVQYGKWLVRAAQFDFGPSRTYNIPATEFIFEQRLGNTILLSIAAFILALIIGLPIGIYSAIKQYSLPDYMITFVSFVGLSVPVFWLGTMMMLVFSKNLNLLPAGGLQSEGSTPYVFSEQKFTTAGQVQAIKKGNGQTVIQLSTYDINLEKDVNISVPVPNGTNTTAKVGDYIQEGDPIGEKITFSSLIAYLLDRLKYLIMPAFALSIISMAVWTRFMRASLLEVINQDYIRTARAKGLKQRVIIYKHALRNSLIPIVTLVGLSIPGLFGGAVLTERVFNWPGMGTALIESLLGKDYNVAMVILMLLAILTLVFNLITDLVYGLVDPRIRYS